MKKLLGILFAASLLLPAAALAQTAATYQLTDSALTVHQVRGWSCQTSQLCLAQVPIDFTGALLGVTANPFFVAPGAGQTFPVSGNVGLTGSLPAFASPPSIANTSFGISGTLPAFASPPTIANTSFGISGTLPAFATTPTVNLGTLNGAATQTTLASILTALGTPFQAGASIGNTSFGISGTLPAFAAPPAFKLNTSPSNANGNGVIINGLPAAARNFPGCTVGASSAQCLAASTAINFLQVQNASPSASVACAFGASAVLNSSGSFQLGPGQSAHWGPETAGVPSGALNCIASAASTPLYEEWN
jgi:hypothetical protein